MAAANKSTGLQIALVFTVMSMIIAFVVAFLQYRSAADAELKLAAERDAHSKSETDKTNATNDLQSLRQFLGYPNTESIGKPEAEGENSVIGQLRALMAKTAPGELTQPTVAATFHRIGQELDTLQQKRSALNAQTIDLNKQILALRAEYQGMVDAHEKAKTKAETDRQEAQASKEELVTNKEKALADRQKELQDQQQANQQIKSDAAKLAEQQAGRIDILGKINFGLRSEKDAREKWSFEVPSGKIELVDLDTRRVWINRGVRDNLRKGTTFSVYKQVNEGVARGLRDIKGAIEVTAVMPDMAEARITRDRISDPIVKGDEIYTPLWSPGRKEKFAFVGLIDLDNDGINDRDVLHDLVAASGGEIVDEVDDKGVRHPTAGNINVGTKFLVVGKIPDAYEAKPEDKEGYQRIGEAHKNMVKEAQEHGVRVVTLEDFLNYVGYEPGRRIWRPGITQTWNLRQGASGNVARPDTKGRPESMGRTSRAFTNPNAPQMESMGTTSKVGQGK
ncbi:MAG TPA: hypothetical protein VGP76_17990 [Planctomycetaceae bacterium]|jgi:hypothetical protein|nr:hypothetical protein [Planctomycetaceae bacterium]